MVEATTRLLVVMAAVVWKVSRSRVGTMVGVIVPGPLRGLKERQRERQEQLLVLPCSSSLQPWPTSCLWLCCCRFTLDEKRE